MDWGWVNTLVGGAVAIAGGFASTWYQAKVARDSDARQLAMSIKGELSGLVQIATQRDYVRGIQGALEFVELTDTPYILGVSVRRDYMVVYTQNASRIGLLRGDLPTKVAVVYTKLSAIIEDFNLLFEVRVDASRREEFTAAHCIEFYRELQALIVGTLAEAREVIREIDAACASSR